MPNAGSVHRFFSRALIGFWFAGLSMIGFARFFMRAFREDTFKPDVSAWVWLIGTIMLGLAGAYIIVREARRNPGR